MKPLLCFAVLVLTSAKFGVAEEKKAAKARNNKSHDNLEAESSHILNLHPAFQQLGGESLDSKNGYSSVFNKDSGQHVIDLLNIKDFSDPGGKPPKTLDDYALKGSVGSLEEHNFKGLGEQQGVFESEGYKIVPLGDENQQGKFTSGVSLNPVPSFDSEYYKSIKNLGLDDHKDLNSGFGDHNLGLSNHNLGLGGHNLGLDEHNFGNLGLSEHSLSLDGLSSSYNGFGDQSGHNLDHSLHSSIEDYKGLDFGLNDQKGLYFGNDDHNSNSGFIGDYLAQSHNQHSTKPFGKGTDLTKGTTVGNTNTKHTSINLEHIGKPVMDNPTYGGTLEQYKPTKLNLKPNIVKDNSGKPPQWEKPKGDAGKQAYPKWEKPKIVPLTGEEWSKPELENFKAQQKPQWEAHIGKVKVSKPSGASVSVFKFDDKTKTYVDSSKLNYGEVGPPQKNPYPNKPVHPKGVPVLKYEILHKKPSTEDELLKQAVDSGAAIIKHVPVAYAEYIDKPHPLKIYVEKPVLRQKIVKVPYKVPIPKPVIMERKVPYPVKVFQQVAKPYPVYKDVPVPKVVYVDKPVPKYVEKPYPVKVLKPKDGKKMEGDRDLKDDKPLTWDEFEKVKATTEEKYSEYYKSKDKDEESDDKEKHEWNSSHLKKEGELKASESDDWKKEWKAIEKSAQPEEWKSSKSSAPEEWKSYSKEWKVTPSEEEDKWKIYKQDKAEDWKHYGNDQLTKASEELKSYTSDQSAKASEEWKSYSGDQSAKAAEEWKSYIGDQSAKASDEWTSHSGDQSAKALKNWKSYSGDQSSKAAEEWKSYSGDQSAKASEDWKSHSGDQSAKALEEWKSSNGDQTAKASKEWKSYSSDQSAKASEEWKSYNSDQSAKASEELKSYVSDASGGWKAYSNDQVSKASEELNTYSKENLSKPSAESKTHTNQPKPAEHFRKARTREHWGSNNWKSLEDSANDKPAAEALNATQVTPNEHWKSVDDKPAAEALTATQETPWSSNGWKSMEDHANEKHYEPWQQSESQSLYNYDYPDIITHPQGNNDNNGRWSKQIQEVSESQEKPSVVNPYQIQVASEMHYQDNNSKNGKWSKQIQEVSESQEKPSVVNPYQIQVASEMHYQDNNSKNNKWSKQIQEVSESEEKPSVVNPYQMQGFKQSYPGKVLNADSPYPGKIFNADSTSSANSFNSMESNGYAHTSSTQTFKPSQSLGSQSLRRGKSLHNFDQSTYPGKVFDEPNPQFTRHSYDDKKQQHKDSVFKASKPLNNFYIEESSHQFKQPKHNQFEQSAMLSFTPNEGKDAAENHNLPLNSRPNTVDMLKSLDTETSASEHITTKKQLYPVASEEFRIDGGFVPLGQDSSVTSTKDWGKTYSETTTVRSKFERKRRPKTSTQKPSVITMESGFAPMS